MEGWKIIHRIEHALHIREVLNLIPGIACPPKLCWVLTCKIRSSVLAWISLGAAPVPFPWIRLRELPLPTRKNFRWKRRLSTYKTAYLLAEVDVLDLRGGGGGRKILILWGSCHKFPQVLDKTAIDIWPVGAWPSFLPGFSQKHPALAGWLALSHRALIHPIHENCTFSKLLPKEQTF